MSTSRREVVLGVTLEAWRRSRHAAAIALLAAARRTAPVSMVVYAHPEGDQGRVEARVLGIGTDVIQVAAALIASGQQVPMALRHIVAERTRDARALRAVEELPDERRG